MTFDPRLADLSGLTDPVGIANGGTDLTSAEDIHRVVTSTGSVFAMKYPNFNGYTIWTDFGITLTEDSPSFHELKSGGLTIEMILPVASTASGKAFTFWKSDNTGGACIVTPQGGDTINHSGSSRNLLRYHSITVVSDGIDNWSVVDRPGDSGTDIWLGLFSDGNNDYEFKYPNWGGLTIDPYGDNLVVGRASIQMLQGSVIDLLPVASTARGKVFVFKQVGGGTATINPNGTDTIDGVAAAQYVAPDESLVLVCDGISNWSIVDRYTPILSVARGGTGTSLFTSGSATFSTAGSVTVSDTSITASSKIVVTQSGNTVLADTYSVDVDPGTGFTIYSTNPVSTATVNYIRVG